MYKVLLTTSGIGSRLGDITKHQNKALVPIHGKATVSYILDSYPEDVPFVVTLGYRKNEVRDFLTTGHANRVFEFVEVDKYEGEGTSLLYSMLSAEENLSCPFIFHACDTILTESIPEPSEDWVAGYMVDPKSIDSTHYRTHLAKDGYLMEIQDRGADYFDSVHLGMTGIQNHELFWKVARELCEQDPKDQSLCDTQIVEAMMKQGATFKIIPYHTWLDTGNPDSLKKTKEAILRNNGVLH